MIGNRISPWALKNKCWPHVRFYREQIDVVNSVEKNVETYVTAGNKLGKDFVAGFIIVNFFLRALKCGKTCRVVTTSVAERHLKVLWAEIGRFVMTSKIPLLDFHGGPLVLQSQEIRRAEEQQSRNPLSYIVGLVSESGEGLAGHHADWTLGVVDEASGSKDKAFEMLQGWAKRLLIFGNPNACENFFKAGVKAGDLKAQTNNHYDRKVLKITADNSPNVRWAHYQIKHGMQPTDEVVTPGVLTWGEYQQRRRTWDKIRQCVGLDANFYEGAEVLLYPTAWLDRAHDIDLSLKGTKRRGKALGCDPGEGGDKTAWAIVDDRGLLHMESIQTPDTSKITGRTIALGREWGVPPERWLFDRGGGGKEHADRLRQMGYDCRSMGFGEAPYLEAKRGLVRVEERKENKEDRYAYKNRRAEMYGDLRTLLDPSATPLGFGIPMHCTELRRQLAPLPLWYDEEGRLFLPPKQRKPTDKEDSEKITINKLIGCSPDEADAFVLAVYAMSHKSRRIWAGAIA
jgi:hypothetical protein